MFEVISELGLTFFIAVVIIQFFPELGIEELYLIGLVLIETIRCQWIVEYLVIVITLINQIYLFKNFEVHIYYILMVKKPIAEIN
jgi:hypothetical protein